MRFPQEKKDTNIIPGSGCSPLRLRKTGNRAYSPPSAVAAKAAAASLRTPVLLPRAYIQERAAHNSPFPFPSSFSLRPSVRCRFYKREGSAAAAAARPFESHARQAAKREEEDNFDNLTICILSSSGSGG